MAEQTAGVHDRHGLMAEALSPSVRELPPPRRPAPMWLWSDSDLTALVTESILSQPKRRLRPSEFRSNP
jgi:hypothetical protein